MKIETLTRTQELEGTPEEVFPFFADAHNLEAITPPLLRFRVLTPRPIQMETGALIEYRLRIRGMPVRWKTRIEEWSPSTRFVDRQLSGPYRLWHHTHDFEPLPGERTLMTDTVRYSVGFGLAGSIAQKLFVDRDVAGIFDYRASVIGPLLEADIRQRAAARQTA